MTSIHIKDSTIIFSPGVSPEALASLERAMTAVGRAGPEVEPTNVQTTPERPAIAIGDYWVGQGGFFAGDFLGDDGRIYGLIVADCGSTKDVGCARHCQTGDRDLSQWDGLDNTNRLKNDCPAALIASQYSKDGHNDFYLPARRELQLAVANVPGLFGTEDWYWSSTPYGEDYAWAVDFEDGYTSSRNLLNEFRVRPIRRFIY